MENNEIQECISYLKSWLEELQDQVQFEQIHVRKMRHEEQISFLNQAIEIIEELERENSYLMLNK